MELINNMMEPQTEGPFNCVLFGDKAYPWSGIVEISLSEDYDEIRTYQDGSASLAYIPSGRLSGEIESAYMPEPLRVNQNLLFHPTISRFETFDMVYTVGRYFHILYNMSITQVGREVVTFMDDPDIVTYPYGFTTRPIKLTNNAPVSHIIIDLENISEELKRWISDTFYQDTSSVPRPDEILSEFNARATLQITDNGDGTWTATSMEEGVIEMTSSTEFKIGWPSAIFIDGQSYLISTY